MTAYNGVCFPATGLLAAVYRLVLFADGFPFAVFSSCFLGAMALPFGAQDFEIPIY